MAVRIQRPAAGARRERDGGALRVIDDELVHLVFVDGRISQLRPLSAGVR
jgi:hypothetical protein